MLYLFLLVGDILAQRRCKPRQIGANSTIISDDNITSSSAYATTTITTTTATTSALPVAGQPTYPAVVPKPTPSSVVVPTKPVTTPKPSTATKTAQPAASGLPANFQSCVDLHNKARAEVGLPPLTASASLSASAEAYAQVLKQRYGNGPLQLEHSKGRYGENLYANTGGVTCAGAYNGWVTEEKPKYKPGTAIGGPNFKLYGHYTQIIYRPVTQVGCSSENGRYYVCHYDQIQDSNAIAG